MIKYWEQFCFSVSNGEKGRFFTSTVNVLLKIVSWIYGFSVWVRNFAYDRGILRCYTPPVPVVVSVGNIVAGGTGKTPLTSMLLKAIAPHFSAAVLTRGYRSLSEHQKKPKKINKKILEGLTPEECGDEPFMLAKNHPDVSIYVGKNRRQSAILAAKEGAKLVVLDDGLQHRKLTRDFDLVLMDANALFGKGGFLPSGNLRDNRSSLTRASIVIISNVTDPQKLEQCRKEIGRWTPAPVMAVKQTLTGAFDLKGKKVELEAGAKIGAFCGIAQPERFFFSLEEMGLSLVDRMTSPDHMLPSKAVIEKFSRRCQGLGANFLVCTEKDAVKISDSADHTLPIIYVKMELEIIYGNEDWLNLVEAIIRRTGQRGNES